MISLDLVIPSKGRIQKLENCLNSILMSARATPVNLYLYFSVQEELDYFQKFFQNIDEVHLELLDDYRVPDFWNSHLQKMTADAMLYGNDDISFYDNTIELIIKKFEELGTDIVLGLSQSNLPEGQALEGAFGVIGSKFADRFPNRQVWCPEYYRFRGDYELWLYAKEINKFIFDKQIKIEHFHPAFYKDKLDQTHEEVRKFLAIDNEIYRRRQSKKFLWGRDFNLLTK